MATQVPRVARLEVPTWFWGGDIAGYFDSAKLKATGSTGNTTIDVETAERVTRQVPGLVRVTQLAGPGTVRESFDIVTAPETAAMTSLGLPSLVSGNLDAHITELLMRAQSGPTASAFAAGMAAHQLQTLAAGPADLADAIQTIFEDISAISSAETGRPAFPNASVHFIQRDAALMHRTKLAAVLLRIEHDESLQQANIQAITEANTRGELVFAASGALGNGMALLDPYLAPLFAAMTPFVWAIPATRLSGTIVYALGSQIRGTESSAAEPLQLLPVPGADESSSAPTLAPKSAGATIKWWMKRLDRVLAVVSDPAVYTDANGRYVPSKHLHAQLSVEQLFRRIGSVQRTHRDTDARRVLLFTTLDTLERVSGRTLTTMCDLPFARRTYALLKSELSDDVGRLLLPAAERAVVALESVQQGFFLARQGGNRTVDFDDADGTRQSLTLDQAAAEYVRVLRNATHGHGSNRAEAKLRTDALLAHHDGSLPHDLALLGYLYLLDLLCHPDNLRRTLWDGGKA